MAGLVARAPLGREALDERAQRGLGAVGRPSDAPPKLATARDEFEKLGDLSALMAEYTEEALFKSDLPSHLFNNLARAWDIFELYKFAASGFTENRGDVAAMAGKAGFDLAKRRIEKQAGKAAAKRWVFVKWGGGLVAAAWVTYEAFELGAWLRGRWDAERRLAQRNRDAWRHAMMRHVWLDYLPALAQAREEKFDELMGGAGRMGWGHTPALTVAAAKRSVALMNEASDNWRELLPVWEESAKFVATHRGADPESKTGADVAGHKQQIAAIVDRLAGHFARVRDFETDPANWALTNQQRELLASHGSAASDDSL